MDAVYELLLEKSVRELTMESVAKRAKVGKPTLYKWWPSKAALILTMFHERLAGKMETPDVSTAEQAIRAKTRRLIAEFNGLFGGILADLIAEGQSNPAILEELYQRHFGMQREAAIADVERGKQAGEFPADTNPALLVEAIFGPIYYRLLLRFAPLTPQYGDALIDQVLRGSRKA
jgi:AcrR family transcriptional regulator